MKIQSMLVSKTGLMILIGVVITSLALTAFSPGSVQANNPNQDATPTPPSLGSAGKDPAFLERALQREQRANKNLEILFNKTDKIISQIEKAILNGEENGKDVTALKNGLRKFEDQITTARTAFDEATRLLTGHPGFDNSGKLADEKLATETIREIGKDQREVRQILGRAIRDALKAIHRIHRNNPVE
jgi:hypothetical protein